MSKKKQIKEHKYYDLCQMIANPAFCYGIKIQRGSYLLGCKWSKKDMVDAIKTGYFSDEEVQEIIKQVIERQKEQKRESRLRKRRFKQYIEDIKLAILNQDKANSGSECGDLSAV